MASCDDEEAEGRIEMDIEASDLVQTELNAILNRMECALGQLSPAPNQQMQQQQQQMPAKQQNLVYSSASSSTPKPTAKLPKLEVKKFSGKIQEWQEFWDSFESAIDRVANSHVDSVTPFRSIILLCQRSPYLVNIQLRRLLHRKSSRISRPAVNQRYFFVE